MDWEVGLVAANPISTAILQCPNKCARYQGIQGSGIKMDLEKGKYISKLKSQVQTDRLILPF